MAKTYKIYAGQAKKSNRQGITNEDRDIEAVEKAKADLVEQLDVALAECAEEHPKAKAVFGTPTHTDDTVSIQGHIEY